MKIAKVLIWIAIAISFLRGLFVLDGVGSAADMYPTASAICMAGAIIGAAIMMLAERKSD